MAKQYEHYEQLLVDVLLTKLIRSHWPQIADLTGMLTDLLWSCRAHTPHTYTHTHTHTHTQI